MGGLWLRFINRLNGTFRPLLTLGYSIADRAGRKTGPARALLAAATERLTMPFKKDLDLYSRLGFTLLLDRSSIVDASVIQYGEWEAAQLDFLKRLMEVYRSDKENIFLDIGAYWGLYSLVAQRTGIFSQILAFESDRHNLAQLQSSLLLNRVSGHVTVFHNAVSHTNDIIYVMDSLGHPTGNRAGVGVVDKSLGLPTAEVASITIDSLLHFSRRNLVIKIDVEGHEQYVLAGMAHTLRNNRVIMQIKVFEPQQAAVFPLLEALGLRQIHHIGFDFFYTNIGPDVLGL